LDAKFGLELHNVEQERVLACLREEQLVDDDVMRVDLVSRQFLNETLCLVQGQELGDTNANERGLFLHII
jgi:hypothetical protein